MALNWVSNCDRKSAFSASACAFSLAARSRSAWALARCASFSRFRRSASFCAAAICDCCPVPPVRFVLGSRHPGVVLVLQPVRFILRSAILASFWFFSRSASFWAAAIFAVFSRSTRSVSDWAASRAASASWVTRAVLACASARWLFG